jgi:high affinity choline transporter 7
LPPTLIGMIGATTNWAALGISTAPQPAMVLPMVIRHLTPSWVGLLVIAAIAAASLAALEASILSAASMFVWNILRPLREKNSSAADQGAHMGYLRWTMIAVGLAAALLALGTSSVYTLWYLSSDLVYVVLLPQLIAVLFFRGATARGALMGMGWALAWRIACGEPSLGLPALVPEEWLHYPFRTLIMLSSLLCIRLKGDTRLQ